MTVTVAVHTNDAAPNAAPNKISRKPGFDKADVTLTLNAIPGIIPRDGVVPRVGLTPGDPDYRAIRVNNAGRDGSKFGWWPSIQRGLVCGIGDRCGPGRRSLKTKAAVVLDDVTVAELAAVGDDTEGNHTQFVYFMTDEGWF